MNFTFLGSLVILILIDILLCPSPSYSDLEADPATGGDEGGPGDGGKCYFIYSNVEVANTYLFGNPNTPFALTQNCTFEFQHRHQNRSQHLITTQNRTWGGALVWFNGVNSSSTAKSSMTGAQWWDWSRRDRFAGEGNTSSVNSSEQACKEYVVTFELVVRRFAEPSDESGDDPEIASTPIPYYYCADGVRRYQPLRAVGNAAPSHMLLPHHELRDAYTVRFEKTQFMYRMPSIVRGDTLVNDKVGLSSGQSSNMNSLPAIFVVFRLENAMPITDLKSTDHLVPALRMRVISNVTRSAWTAPPQSMAHSGLLGGALMFDNLLRTDPQSSKMHRYCNLNPYGDGGSNGAASCAQNKTFRALYQHDHRQYECSCVQDKCSSIDVNLKRRFQCKDKSSCIPIESTCDYTPDCPDGSDENSAVCKYPFQCNFEDGLCSYKLSPGVDLSRSDDHTKGPSDGSAIETILQRSPAANNDAATWPVSIRGYWRSSIYTSIMKATARPTARRFCLSFWYRVNTTELQELESIGIVVIARNKSYGDSSSPGQVVVHLDANMVAGWQRADVEVATPFVYNSSLLSAWGSRIELEFGVLFTDFPSLKRFQGSTNGKTDKRLSDPISVRIDDISERNGDCLLHSGQASCSFESGLCGWEAQNGTSHWKPIQFVNRSAPSPRADGTNRLRNLNFTLLNGTAIVLQKNATISETNWLASSAVLLSPPIPARLKSHSQILLWRYYCILSSNSTASPPDPASLTQFHSLPSQSASNQTSTQLGVRLQWSVRFCGRTATVDGVCLDPSALSGPTRTGRGGAGGGGGGAGRVFWLPIKIELHACSHLSRASISLRNAFSDGNTGEASSIPKVEEVGIDDVEFLRFHKHSERRERAYNVTRVFEFLNLARLARNRLEIETSTKRTPPSSKMALIGGLLAISTVFAMIVVGLLFLRTRISGRTQHCDLWLSFVDCCCRCYCIRARYVGLELRTEEGIRARNQQLIDDDTPEDEIFSLD